MPLFMMPPAVLLLLLLPPLTVPILRLRLAVWATTITQPLLGGAVEIALQRVPTEVDSNRFAGRDAEGRRQGDVVRDVDVIIGGGTITDSRIQLRFVASRIHCLCPSQRPEGHEGEEDEG